MSFGGAPKQDPALVAAQKSEAAQAQRDQISTLSDQLDQETRLRAAMFGRRSMLSAFTGGSGSSGGSSGGLFGRGSGGIAGGFFSH